MFRLPFLSSGAAHSSPCYRLSVISPYAAELGFFLDIDRLRVQGTHVLPALQSALTLWSAHITSTSEPDHVQSHERAQTLTSNLLSQTQAQLASALSTLDDEFDPAIFLHVIQTGVLLAYYMQRIGQEVGARYYASGTWALGTMLKLYRSPHLSAGVGEGEGQSLRGGDVHERSMYGNASAFVGGARLKPALDGIEAEERVRAFWALYALDRWFSAVGQGPCQSFATDENAMTVPWPDAGSMDEVSQLRPLFLLARLDTQFGLIGEECGPASSSRSKSRLYAGWSFCDACQGVSVARRGNGGRGVVCGWYTPSSYLILSCVLIGYFFFGCRPSRQPNARVSSSFRDIGRASSTVFECGDDDGNWTSVTAAGTRDGPPRRVRTHNPASTLYLDIRAVSKTVCRGGVGCCSGAGSDG